MVRFDAALIDAIFADLDRSDMPGATVGVAHAGQVLYRRGFGLANIELPARLAPDMRMRIYSATKQFTCLAALLLCEDGKADIDDRLDRHLPELHSVCHPVTLRQLMSNTGGLRDAFDIGRQFSGTGKPARSTQVLDLYRTLDDRNFEPGQGWSYNNGGFLLLSAVIERLSGQSLEEVFRQRIFSPLGMGATMLRRHDRDFVANSATMHMTTRDGGFVRSYFGADCAGEGGIVSTVDDMLVWLEHLSAPRIGDAATWKAIRTACRLPNGTQTGYGLGLFVDSYRGFQRLHHPGGGMGANSQTLTLPEVGLSVVVMTNRHDCNASDRADAIVDACLGLERSAEAPPVLGSDWIGLYRGPFTGHVVKIDEQGVEIDACRIPFVETTPGRLEPHGVFAGLRIGLEEARDGNGRRALRHVHYGDAELMFPVEPAEGGRPITGTYLHAASGSWLKVLARGDDMALETGGPFGVSSYGLRALSADLWRAEFAEPMPWGGVLSFPADRSRVLFSSERSWSLPFERAAGDAP